MDASDITLEKIDGRTFIAYSSEHKELGEVFMLDGAMFVNIIKPDWLNVFEARFSMIKLPDEIEMEILLSTAKIVLAGYYSR